MKTADTSPFDRSDSDFVGAPEIARKFAELALRSNFSDQEATHQLPLAITDRGDRWFVEGSWNRAGSEPTGGPFLMVIRKRDAAVLDFGVPAVSAIPPDAERRFQAILQATGYQETEEQRQHGLSDDAKWHLDVTEWFTGGVLNNQSAAGEFAKLIIEGQGHSMGPHPQVADHGTEWVVTDEADGRALYLVVKKRDAQIVYFGPKAAEATRAAPPRNEQTLRTTSLREHLLQAGRREQNEKGNQ